MNDLIDYIRELDMEQLDYVDDFKKKNKKTVDNYYYIDGFKLNFNEYIRLLERFQLEYDGYHRFVQRNLPELERLYKIYCKLNRPREKPSFVHFCFHPDQYGKIIELCKKTPNNISHTKKLEAKHRDEIEPRLLIELTKVTTREQYDTFVGALMKLGAL